MKKILLLLTGLSLMFAACDYSVYDACVWVCGIDDDGAGNATFTVCSDSQTDIAGWQFSLDAGDDFTVTSSGIGSAGSAAGLQNFGSGGLILVFSMSGAFMPSGEGLEIATFTGTYTTSGVTEEVVVDFGSGALADSGANSLSHNDIVNGWVSGDNLLDAETPAEYSLKAAYPNPFNPTTTIEYNVSEPGNVNIVIYDMMGREIKTLVNDVVSPRVGGNYSVVWDGTNNANAFVATGVYVYRMIANNFVKTQKMTLTK